MKRIEVAIAIVCNQGKVLICKRREQDHLGGFWEFPGGKVEPGESPKESVIREIREEVQIEVEVLSPLDVIEHDYPDRHVRLHPFLCAYQLGELIPLGCEIANWVDPKSLQDYHFPPANDELIEKVVRLICHL